MKKLKLFFAFMTLSLLVTFSASGQDVKLQKNKILIGGKEVGTTEKFNNKETKKKGYIFSDKEGNNKLYFEKQTIWDGVWYVIRPDFMADTAELKHEYLHFTFNEHAALAELLVKKYDFYGPEGMRPDMIREYINTAEKSAIANRIAVFQEKRQFQKTLEETKISVEADKIITRGSEKEIVGFLTFGSELTPDGQTDSYIVVQDEHKNTIAKVRRYKSSSECVIYTFDGKEISYDSPVLYAQDEAKFNLYLACFIGYKEYFKGQPYAYATVVGALNEKERKEKEELNAIEKEDFDKRVNITGILYMKDGEMYTGKFQIKFRQTENGSLSHIKTINNYDYGAQLLVHSFIDPEKNKEKKKTFNVKKSLRLEIDPEYTTDQRQEIYDAVRYSFLREYSNAEGLDLMQFIKLPAVEIFALRIIHTPVICLNYYKGVYILKKVSEEKGVGSKKFKANDLKMIAKDCPEVLKKIEEGHYLNKGTDLIQFVSDYTNAEKITR